MMARLDEDLTRLGLQPFLLDSSYLYSSPGSQSQHFGPLFRLVFQRSNVGFYRPPRESHVCGALPFLLTVSFKQCDVLLIQAAVSAQNEAYVMGKKVTIKRSHLIPAQIIWGVLTSSLFVFTFVSQELKNSVNANSAAPSELNLIFPLIAMALLGAALAIRRFNVIPPPRIRGNLSPSQGAVVRYLPRMLICLALHEAVAILGFVMALLSNSPAAIYPYVFAAFVANLFVFPSAERVRS